MMPIVLRSFYSILLIHICAVPIAAGSDSFQAGYAEHDITPPPGLPMWGYGARHSMKATGAMDQLAARAIVIQAGGEKLAIVGLDIGRGPTAPMMNEIRAAVKKQAGI